MMMQSMSACMRTQWFTHRHTDKHTDTHTDTHTHIGPVAQPVHVGDEQVEQPLKKLGAA